MGWGSLFQERTVSQFYRIYSDPVFVRIYLLEKGEQERMGVGRCRRLCQFRIRGGMLRDLMAHSM